MLIELLNQGKRIINIDETILKSTDHRKKGWVSYGKNTIVSHSQRLNLINMIAAISNKGECFYTINHGYTNSITFLFFLTKLIKHLNIIDENWRHNTILLIDNAPYHRSKMIMEVYQAMKLPIMFLGPYQYKLAPVELFFSFIKNRDLNPVSFFINKRVQLSAYMKELCIHISKLDTSWIPKGFRHILSDALDSISLKNL